MAIPDSPNWSSLTDVKAYPQPAFVKPATPDGVAAVSLGPIMLNDSQGVLNSRYWLVTQNADTGNVEIAGAVGGEWDLPVPLFSEATDVEQISLTFDQLGRPLVFYNTDTSDLKLYWYNPVTETNEVKSIGIGYDPVACFDFPQDTSQSFSDMLVFYVRGQQVYMRIQRDRFDIEYACPANQPGITITSAGLRVDNRYQVVYQYPAADYVPPIVPPPVIPVTGDYYYLNSWGSCLVSNYRLDVVTQPFKMGFKVRDAFFPHYWEELASAYQGQIYIRPENARGQPFKQFQVMFGSDDHRQFYCYIERDTRNNKALINMWRGHRQLNATFELDDFNGEWEFEFRGLSSLVTIRKDGIVIFNNALAQPDPSKVTPTLITFAGSLYVANNVNTYQFHGVQYDCWIEHNGNRIDWAVQNNGLAQQYSLPAGNDMTIRNHRTQNWKFIAS